jgi:thiol:disulfide interchange protein DsbD
VIPVRTVATVLALGALPGPSRQVPTVPVALVPELAWVRPGTTFRVAARIQLPAGWHIGWKHPGQTGLPTTIAWRVPSGILVGPTEWGFPERAESAGVISHVYRDEALLTTSFTVGADARPGSAELVAEMHWGLCREICIPQERQVQVALPVVSAARAADTSQHWGLLLPILTERLPVSPEDAGLEARRDPRGIRLTTRPSGRKIAADTVIFFPENPSRSALAVVIRPRVTATGLLIPLAVPPDTAVDGVLVSTRGWGTPGGSRALRIAIP